MLRLVGAIVLWSASSMLLLAFVVPQWAHDNGRPTPWDSGSGGDAILPLLIIAMAGMGVWVFLAGTRGVAIGVVALAVMVNAQISTGSELTYMLSLAAVAGAVLLSSNAGTGSSTGTATIDSGPPAGWYPDPADGNVLRYWSGTDWTEHTRNTG